ncbi:hypothetical protein MKX03_037362 [Papaver bracteatum]|nr:hypothetical protein MKX03_037362 [Papaver bracteatum]
MKDKEGKLSVEMKNKPGNEILPTNVQVKKVGNEIDEKFAIKKKRKKELKEVSEGVAFVDPPSRPRRKTNDGITIYSETELGVANSDAGGTRLCPLDCSCCF